MKILIINPPHPAIGSRLAGEHLPPLGLLCVAGPLIDAGHEVHLLDADYSNMPLEEIVAQAMEHDPDAILMGHSGSTSAQPVIDDIVARIAQTEIKAALIIGGVFPTFHWAGILRDNPRVDYIVCGEGEATVLNLVTAIERNEPPEHVRGLALRIDGEPMQTPPAETIENLDDYRIAWELAEKCHYTYWGGKKAVVVQFSRGCPHGCTYCGQRIFWRKWRHRDPQRFADELEMLHREYGVEVFNFADENMSADPTPWREFLEILVAKNLNLILVGSIRADNIVRDADFLHLYKQAGFERFLLGIENYDEAVLKKIRKGGTAPQDRQAIQLLRKHGILSMATYVVGFADERFRDLFRTLRQLFSYDPDQIQSLYVTPHEWTPYFDEAKDREIIVTDQRLWDYKHLVLAPKHLSPWFVLLCVKLIEVTVQARPKALVRLLFHREKRLRKAMFWYTRIGRRVWFWELWHFFFAIKRIKPDKRVRLEDFWK